MKYLVVAEIVTTHSAVVLAENEDDAAQQYLDGEWVEDRGDTFDDDSAMVLSVGEIE